MKVDWTRFREVIAAHQSFVLTSHIRPDCDALGSELAMAAILDSLGKQVRIVNGQATPPNLAFIDARQRIEVIGQGVTISDLAATEAVMVLDTSAWAQLGPMAEVVQQLEATRLVLDHHVGEDDLGAILFKDVEAEATGRLVADAAEQLGVPLTPEVAYALFAAVATDTGWFRFASTSASTYELAAKLCSAGVRPDQLYAQLYEQETLGRLRLRGLILSRLTLELDGRLVHTYVQQDDYQSAGALPSDTEDAINLALSIGGTQFAVIVVEQPGGGCKISFRSRCQLDCSQLARHFGGGGHKKAAGAFIDEPLAQAQSLVLDHVRAALR